jgi:hypothetical protein
VTVIREDPNLVPLCPHCDAYLDVLLLEIVDLGEPLGFGLGCAPG